MNYGLYLSAAGALASMEHQAVLTNNLANATTVGFMPDQVFGRQRLPERLESGAPTDPKLLLERLGGAAALNPMRLIFKQGTIVDTGNRLDVALRGEGFFVVRSADRQVYLTRDGRFELAADGRLVMASTGMQVLDDRDQPIRLDRSSDVQINADGSITQGGDTLATLAVASPQDPQRLVKVGQNLLRSADGDAARRPAGALVHQGAVESSAVDPITTLKDLMAAAKSAQANLKLMQYHDHIMGQAVNTLGRVA